MKVNIQRIIAQSVYQGIASGMAKMAEENIPKEAFVDVLTYSVLEQLAMILELEPKDHTVELTPEMQQVIEEQADETNQTTGSTGPVQ